MLWNTLRVWNMPGGIWKGKFYFIFFGEKYFIIRQDYFISTKLIFHIKSSTRGHSLSNPSSPAKQNSRPFRMAVFCLYSGIWTLRGFLRLKKQSGELFFSKKVCRRAPKHLALVVKQVRRASDCILLPLPERNDNFRQEVVVSFCTFIFLFFSFHSSLKLSFPDKR